MAYRRKLAFSETLGDCSFLNTCYHMDTCKYVHYTIDFPEKKLFNMKSSLQTKAKAEEGSILFPPQVKEPEPCHFYTSFKIFVIVIQKEGFVAASPAKPSFGMTMRKILRPVFV